MHVAVPGRVTDRAYGELQPRSRDQPTVDRLPESEGQTAQITCGRHAGLERGPDPCRRLQHHQRRIVLDDMERSVCQAESEVDVTVDESGQQGLSAQIPYLGPDHDRWRLG